MRIISGTFKGRRITPPKNISARPTTDFAKEGLFNLLQNQIDFDGIDILDLFAGTGGIGIECISRGCRSAIAVELAHTQSDFIKRLKRELGIENLSVVKGDVFKYLKTAVAKFDFIYADPPYDLPDLPTLPALIFEKGLLKESGLFVLEHSVKHNFAHHPNFQYQRHYGSVNFSFFKS